MLLSEATERSAAEAADWLEELPRETLQAMLEAGREVLEWRRILAKTGDNLVGEVLKHEGTLNGVAVQAGPGGRAIRCP